MNNTGAPFVTTGPLSPSTSIDLGHLDEAASELQFQDFSDSHSPASRAPRVSVADQSFDESNEGDEDTDPILGKSSGKQQSAGTSIWDLEFFAKYFDVTTEDVKQRIVWSVIPSPTADNFVDRCIRTNPDLYGPLWINVTLIFSIAICGNIANYLSSGDPDQWHYDFAKVGIAASTVSTYVCFIPIALWFFFWFRGCTAMYTLLQMVCLYGYSMSVYVPISLLWVISARVIQYVLVVIGALASGSVLIFAFAPVVRSDPAQTLKFSYLIFLVIVGLHALIACTFLMYFF